MNLKQVIRRINTAKQSEERIRNKFSSKNNNVYIHQADLKKDEQEDLRIFGFTNAETINYFRHKTEKVSDNKKCQYDIHQPENLESENQEEGDSIFKRRTKTVQEKRRRNMQSGNIRRPPTSGTIHISSSKNKNRTSVFGTKSVHFNKSTKSTAPTSCTFHLTRASSKYKNKDPYILYKSETNFKSNKNSLSIKSEKSISKYR